MNNRRKLFISSVIVLLLNCGGYQTLARAANRSTKSLPANTSRPKPEERFITIDKIRIYYVETGAGRPVVMIHGNAGSLQDFEFGTLGLVSRSYKVIAIDLPGHGQSGVPKGSKGTFDDEALTLHKALNTLGIRRPILVGHSWGAVVALAYALRYPRSVSGLVLLAPAAYTQTADDDRLETLLRIPLLGDAFIVSLKPLLGPKIVKGILERAFYPDQVPDDYLKSANEAWLGRKQIKIYLRDDRMLETQVAKLASMYQKIRLPVIIVTGDSDRLVSPEQNAFRLHKTIGGSKLIVVQHAGHQIPQTHPEAVLRAIEMIRAGSRPQGRIAELQTSREEK
jgi:pimeloyl-ACP methyl ester carboxylesterase